MCAPSPPPSPDYAGAAQQQGVANKETAVIQGKINNPNVINPYGTQTVTWGVGPKGNPTYQPTLTQTFSPSQQALYDQQMQAKGLMGGLGIQGAQALQGIVGTGVDFSGSPARPNPGQINQSVVNAMMQRPMADYGRAVDQSHSDLAAAGIPVGSKAYNTQQDLLGRQLTDAQTQAGLAGIQAGNTWFNQGQAARQAANTEYLAARQTPLNEITALLSGSQVQNPFSIPGYAQNTQVQAAPIFGATQQQGNWDTGIYNQQAAQAGNLQSGLFGLGGAAGMGYMASDRRLKSKIKRIGTHPVGVPWYSYEINGLQECGVMADELEKIMPHAVSVGPDGFQRVNYSLLNWGEHVEHHDPI